jgi:hypothetical protein
MPGGASAEDGAARHAGRRRCDVGALAGRAAPDIVVRPARGGRPRPPRGAVSRRSKSCRRHCQPDTLREALRVHRGLRSASRIARSRQRRGAELQVSILGGPVQRGNAPAPAGTTRSSWSTLRDRYRQEAHDHFDSARAAARSRDALLRSRGTACRSMSSASGRGNPPCPGARPPPPLSQAVCDRAARPRRGTGCLRTG